MTKKQMFLYFLFFCCSYYFALAQETDSLAVVINKEVARMDVVDNWEDIVSFQIENFASKEAFLKLYYFKGALRKIDLLRSDVYSKRENVYYLKNEQLIFVSEKSSEYQTAIDDENYKDSENIVYEALSYFYEGVLVLQIDNEYTGSPLSKKFLEALGNSILDDFNVLIQLSETAK